MMKKLATGALAAAIAVGTLGMGAGAANAASLFPNVNNDKPTRAAIAKDVQKRMNGPLPCDTKMMTDFVVNGQTFDPLGTVKVPACIINDTIYEITH